LDWFCGIITPAIFTRGIDDKIFKVKQFLNLPSFGKKVHIASISVLLIWAFMFGISYAQSPVFTSNQNQYFLHGLANAGFGNLDADWLANTRDPTPVFSVMVEYTYRLFNSNLLFYIYYFLIFGVYLFGLVGIAGTLFDLSNPLAKLTFLTGLLFIHSAALRYMLSFGMGPDWIYIFEGGLAGQRVLGSVFQPSTFGVFLILSLYLFLNQKVYLSLFAIGIAVVFHPTYLLTSGILVFAYLVSEYKDSKNLKEVYKIALFALILVSPILIYVFQFFSGITSLASSQAQEILVNYRIPHHAIIGEWFNITSVIQLGLIFWAIYLVRNSRLFLIMIIGIISAIVLAVIQLISSSDALALLFPWRISVIFVPISISIILASIILKIFSNYSSQLDINQGWVKTLNLLIIGVLLFIGAVRFSIDLDRKSSSTENLLFKQLQGQGSADEVYLIPLKMQDFRLATGNSIFIDFKSIPYQNSEVIEWYRRNQIAGQIYSEGKVDCGKIDQLSEEEGISHIVFENERRAINCDSFELRYEDTDFLIYQRK
jgi:hypothetical protein